MRPVPNQFPTADPGTVRLALVGESPGADEVAMDYPFAGKSGWALNGYLASAGLSRSQVFVGNVCQHRPSPTSNDFHLLEWNEARVQEGIEALRHDLARFRPNIVVALGNAALHLLRHGNVAPPKSAKLKLFQWSSHIGTWRGSLFLAAASFDRVEASILRFREGRCPPIPASAAEGVNAPPLSPAAQCGPTTSGGSITASPRAPLGDGENAAVPSLAPQQAPLAALPPSLLQAVPVAGGSLPQAGATPATACIPLPAALKAMGTYHPAATFREPSFAFPLVSDLKRAVAEARSPDLVLPERNISWGLSIGTLEFLCETIRKARTPVGFDVEGGLGGLQCVSFARTPHDAFVVDLMGEQLERHSTMQALASVLEDASVPKVLWNAAYERAVLEATSGITLRGYEDGMLAWWERFSELPKGLDFVASILTREPYWASGIGWDRKTGAPKVTGPPFWTYNAIDSMTTLEIWQHPLIRAVAESRTPVAFTASL